MKIRSSSSVFLSDGSKHFSYPNILLEGLVVQPLEAFVVCVRCKVVLAGFRHAAVGVAVEGHAVRVLLVLVDETLVAVHHVQRVGRGHGGDEAAGGDGGLELLSLGGGLRKVVEVGIVRGGVFEVGLVRGARHVRALLHHHLAELTHEHGATATFHSAPVAKVDETGCAGGHHPLVPTQPPPPNPPRILPPCLRPLHLGHPRLHLRQQRLLLVHLLQNLWTSLLIHFFERPLFHAWLQDNRDHHLLCVMARSCPSIDDMCPVLARSRRQLPPPLHDQDAGVADVSGPLLALQQEAVLELVLILVTVGEP